MSVFSTTVTLVICQVLWGRFSRQSKGFVLWMIGLLIVPDPLIRFLSTNIHWLTSSSISNSSPSSLRSTCALWCSSEKGTMSRCNGVAATDEIVFFDDAGFIIGVGSWDWLFEIDVINVLNWKSMFENSNHVVVVGVISCLRSKDIETLKELGHRFFWSAPSDGF